jgi:hypothetical protein
VSVEVTLETQVTLRARFRNTAGILTDPDQVRFKMMKPGRQTVIYTYPGDVTKEDTGTYTIQFVPDLAGRWIIRPEGEGSLTAAGRDFVFDVTDSVFYP